MITLTNGCACCAVSADLTNNLIEITEREEPPDAIVLEAGGVADLCILEEDPMEVDPEHIKDIKIWGTVLGGKPFQAKDQ